MNSFIDAQMNKSDKEAERSECIKSSQFDSSSIIKCNSPALDVEFVKPLETTGLLDTDIVQYLLQTLNKGDDEDVGYHYFQTTSAGISDVDSDEACSDP